MMRPIEENITAVCFADSWDEFERRDMMLLSRLAERKKIKKMVYIEPPVTLTSFLKFIFGRADYYATSAWNRIFKTGIVHRKNNKVWILRPITILPMRRFGGLERINSVILNFVRTWLVKLILKKEQVDLLWISMPYFTADLIKRLRAQVVCYSLCEDWTQKEDKGSWIRQEMDSDDEKITKAADIIFVASEELYEKKNSLNSCVHLVSNGVDFDRVRQASQSAAIPADLKRISSSLRIGHLGFLGRYTDFDLLERLAKENKNLSFILIGPITQGIKEIERIKKYKNIHLLGPKSDKELYSYLVSFDVCLFLYKSTDQNLLRNSMKLYQYLATGKPVISYPLAGAQNIPDLVYVAKTSEEYQDLLKVALKEDLKSLQKARIEFAKNNSWDVRSEQVSQLLFNSLDEKKSKMLRIWRGQIAKAK